MVIIPAYNEVASLDGVLTRLREARPHDDVVVVDDHLSPVQQRNLEKAWQAKVIDRTGLILEIFARRARKAGAHRKGN